MHAGDVFSGCLTGHVDGLRNGARKKRLRGGHHRDVGPPRNRTAAVARDEGAIEDRLVLDTQRFGTLMLIILFAALVGDLIFLPALLTGPVGRFFRPRRKPGIPEPETPEAPEAPDDADLVTASPAGATHARWTRRADASHVRRRVPTGDE